MFWNAPATVKCSKRKVPRKPRQRLANLDELLNAAADAGERGESLRDFLDHAALVSDADSADARVPVSLLTMHNAKGLEFPVVFIAGLEEGLFPHSRSLDSESGMEEERRLCYVGMTRSETKLYLSWARYRRRFGGGQPEVSLASRFLNEVPRNLVDAVRGDQPQARSVDLYSERYQVRESAQRNLYTGKTYNSVDNIRRFFSERGMPAPPGDCPTGSFVSGPARRLRQRPSRRRPFHRVQEDRSQEIGARFNGGTHQVGPWHGAAPGGFGRRYESDREFFPDTA